MRVQTTQKGLLDLLKPKEENVQGYEVEETPAHQASPVAELAIWQGGFQNLRMVAGSEAPSVVCRA
jgi:hypothetical protein